MTPGEGHEGLLTLRWGRPWGASLVCDLLISWPSASLHQVWPRSLPGLGPVRPPGASQFTHQAQQASAGLPVAGAGRTLPPRDTPVLAGVVPAESSGEGSKGRAELRAVGAGTVGLLWSPGDHGPLFPDASCMLLSSGTFRMICLMDHSPTGHKDSFGLLW